MNKKLFLEKSSDHIKSFSKSLKSEFGFDTVATTSRSVAKRMSEPFETL